MRDVVHVRIAGVRSRALLGRAGVRVRIVLVRRGDARLRLLLDVVRLVPDELGVRIVRLVLVVDVLLDGDAVRDLHRREVLLRAILVLLLLRLLRFLWLRLIGLLLFLLRLVGGLRVFVDLRLLRNGLGLVV